MNKFVCGMTALVLMVGSVFADYDIIKLGTGVTNNPKTAYGDYIFVYGTGELEPGNTKDAEGNFVAFEAGYAEIKTIVQKGTTVPATWNAVALGIDNTTATTTPNMGDCSGGFSYEYKGAAHNFELKFDPTLCGGSDENEGSNKWGKKNVTASANLTTITITKSDLETNGLINTWTESKCQTANKPTLDLGKVLQMAWVIDGGTAAVGKTLTIGTVKCLGGTLPSSSSTATPSSSSAATSSPSGGSSSSDAATSSPSGGSSSSDAATSSPSGTSSSSGTNTSSSSSDDPEPIISYNRAPVIGLNVVNFARNLRIASDKNATISLFDINGKQVLNQKILKGTTTISLGKQKVGVYYVVAKSDSQKQIVKIVLK